jgi:rhodanese-related sulfurtransferase
MKKVSLVGLLLLVMAMTVEVPWVIPASDPCKGIPAELAVRKLQRRGDARTVSVARVLQQVKGGRETLLIDVRSPEAFGRFRIPGSINIPLHFVKTKPFLKKKPFILLDEGFRYGLLAEECRKLADAGFPCSVLYGGLTAWRDDGGTLEGDHAAWRSLGNMPAAAFFLEKGGEDWLMIDVSRQRSTLLTCLMPDAVHAEVSGSPEQAVSELSDAERRERTGSFTRILIFNEKGTDYDSIRFLAGKAGLKIIFYLEGGLEQYAAYLNQRRLSALPREARLKMTTGCGSTCGRRK